MGLPKGFKKNINIKHQKVGPERRQEILNDIADQGTFLPRGVFEEDMDSSFIEFCEKDLEIVINGEKVPVIFLTIQRWAEFSKTWQFADKYKDIKLPFITIVRRPDIQVGTNQAGLWNIPGRNTYTYVKEPTWNGVRRGYNVYKIPQPVAVDITYEVRIFCGRMRELNKLHRKIQQAFSSRQFYINVNGHPMPLTLETIGDESNIDDFENRRFYVQNFEIKLAGYIQDPDTFEVIPTIDRAVIFTEVIEEILEPKHKFISNHDTNTFTYSIIFQPNSNPYFSFEAEYDLLVTHIINIENISNIVIKVNGVQVFSGLEITTSIGISSGDVVYIEVSKTASTTGKLTLIGNII